MGAIFYIGRDNSARAELSINCAPVPPANLTKLSVVIDGTEYDDPALFEFGETEITLKFGGLPLAAGDYAATFVAYSIDHPGGIVWGAPVTIRMVAS